MRFSLLFLPLTLLVLLSDAHAQSVVTIPAQTVTIPSQTATVSGQSVTYGARTISLGAQTITMSNTTSTPPVTTPPPASNTPAAGTFWVYHNGTFAWPGDYSWNASINYKDSAGGAPAIGVNITGSYGGWQPFAFKTGGTPFDTRPYKYLVYCTMPTIASQSHGTGFDADNDVADGVPANGGLIAGPGLTKYGPVPAANTWGCYKVPLSDFKFNNPMILKFSVTDGTGKVPNKFYVKDVGFSP